MNADAVQLQLVYSDQMHSEVSEDGYFDALCAIRQSLERDGLMPLCLGACENVFPSPMIQSMGSSEKAYRLTKGRQARLDDLVCIFDADNSMTPVSVDRQREFYDSWIASL